MAAVLPALAVTLCVPNARAPPAVVIERAPVLTVMLPASARPPVASLSVSVEPAAVTSNGPNWPSSLASPRARLPGELPVSAPVVVIRPRPLWEMPFVPPAAVSVTVPELPSIGPASEIVPLPLMRETPEPSTEPAAVTERPPPVVVMDTRPLSEFVTAPETLRPSELSTIVIAPPAVRLPIAPKVLPALLSVTLPPTLPDSVPVLMAAIWVTFPASASPPEPPSTTLPPVLVVIEPITTFPPASSSWTVPLLRPVVSDVPVRLMEPSWASIVIVPVPLTVPPVLDTDTPVSVTLEPVTFWPLRSRRPVVVTDTLFVPVVKRPMLPVSVRPARSLTTTSPP